MLDSPGSPSPNLNPQPDGVICPRLCDSIAERQPRWFVLLTLPRREQDAADAIATLGLLAYLPLALRPATPPRSPRRPEPPRLVPAYPQYLFVHLDLAADPWRRMFVTTHVRRHIVRLLGPSSETPTPVNDAAFTAMVSRLAEFRVDQPKPGRAPIHVGDICRITSGPCGGHTAICVRDTLSAKRIRMHILVWDREVEVPPEFVEPSASADAPQTVETV
jgi:hypothetical protein